MNKKKLITLILIFSPLLTQDKNCRQLPPEFYYFWKNGTLEGTQIEMSLTKKQRHEYINKMYNNHKNE